MAAAFRNTTPTPRVSAGTGVLVCPVGVTICSSVVFELNSAHWLGAVNAAKPAFERWISPADGTVEFRGQHIAVRVLDRDAIQIKKNGKLIAESDGDISVE